jgi:hypothetical protein
MVAAGATTEVAPAAVSFGSPIIAITSPTVAEDSAGTRILRSVPWWNASISRFAFSVSTSASTSPRFTMSPSFLFQESIFPAFIVSLSWGILISTAIGEALKKIL